MNNSSGKPVPQYLKVINILDFIPGYADKPEAGEEIGILTVEHAGEVEQPMMLRLADIRRLFVDTLMILAHHGDDRAEEIVMRYFPPCSERTGHVMAGEDAGDLFQGPAEAPGVQPAKPIAVLTARFKNSETKPLTLHVLGGYRSQGELTSPIMLLVTCPDFGEGHGFVVKLGTKNTVFLRGHAESSVLPKSNWEEFCAARPSSIFKIGEHNWIKMDSKSLSGLIGSVRTVAGYRPRS